jgi:hypothetical protein
MNKKQAIAIIQVVLCIAFLAPLVQADSITINDYVNSPKAYWGGAVQNASSTSYGDVIGNPYYSVDKLMATDVTGGISVILTGYYFYSYSNNIDRAADFGPGDLYLQLGGYVPPATGGPHYATDTFTENEGWDYVVSFENQAIYKLNFGTIEMTGLPNLPDYSNPNQWVYRADQAWRGGYGDLVSNATVSLNINNTDPALSSLTFTFNNTGIGSASELGYHWTMLCGNDVVEGGMAPVPEPSTLVLLGLGLSGIGVVTWRKKK